jgi:hypothetical protein
MGMILRFFLLLCLLYLVVRLVKSWWREDSPRIQGEAKPQISHPLDGAEIVDAQFTELPPDEEQKKSSP